ncbi:Hypothetical protein A7982_00359 [Minicystis rosea]|nr:Hypothetical protein A7982_00359 [Minicystis rosea]
MMDPEASSRRSSSLEIALDFPIDRHRDAPSPAHRSRGLEVTT